MNQNNQETQKGTKDNRAEQDRDIRYVQREDIKKQERTQYGLWGFIWLIFVAISICAPHILKLFDIKYDLLDALFTIIMEICIALMGSFFILYFIEHNRVKSEDVARKKEIKDVFEDTLNDSIIPIMTEKQTDHKNALEKTYVDCLVKKNILVSKLNDDSVDSFMQDCISHYCQQLSEHYKNYIKDSVHVFRKDFNYEVVVDINKKEISQDIAYERFFRDPDNRASYQLKCLFLFGTNELDEAMDDDSYFFREELTNIELLNSINKTLEDSSKDIKQELIDKLDLKITIENEKIKNPEIQYEVLKNNSGDKIGLLFYATIPQEHIRTEDSYIYYKGKVHCNYNYDIDNIFYCIFSNPTTGSTHFSIHFENFDPQKFNFKNVKHITMLSLKKKKKKKNGEEVGDFTLDRSSKNTIAFNAKKTIFPRGGIVIRW